MTDTNIMLTWKSSRFIVFMLVSHQDIQSCVGEGYGRCFESCEMGVVFKI